MNSEKAKRHHRNFCIKKMFGLALRNALCTFLFLAGTYGENYFCDQNDLRSLFVHLSRLSSTVNKLSTKTDSIDVLEEISNLKNVSKNTSALNSSVNALKEEADNLKDVLENTTTLIKNLIDNNSKLSEDIADFRMSLNDIRGQMQHIEDTVNVSIQQYYKTDKPIDVAFIATGPMNSTFNVSGVIVFPVIVLNEGNGYDNSSGVFTAPVNGSYSFSVAVCPHSDSSIFFRIMVNYTLFSASFIGRNNNANCHSAGTVVLSQGQKVWVESASRASLVQDEFERWNSFSGVLVNG